MLYLGIDQHARQITISLRDEQRRCPAGPPGLDAAGEGPRLLPATHPRAAARGRVVRRRARGLWLQRLADDAAFLRRIYLDLIGDHSHLRGNQGLPGRSSTDKRSKLIDRLLDDPRYADQQADIWEHVLISRTPLESGGVAFAGRLPEMAAGEVRRQ